MLSKKPPDWLHLQRASRFGDIDTAGVIHFHNLFRWCHEAWEESLERYGINAVDVFPSIIDHKSLISIALPIVHCEADFFAPIRIAENLEIELVPIKLDPGSFQVKYNFYQGKNIVAVALIRHRSINIETRHPCSLPEGIQLWLEASSLNKGISSL
ncbi:MULTISPECIES: acyl-CoA thioesterase [unclassified Prochlorococcus]|uniref:acyl-CoA thioesterase n=1 Tax=unclassified Prochlorococcus TaxID=2627481 RepID=UPI0005337E59|nr:MULTISPECIES: thioesterase family protein [unclassified Prochlorococcus]KGG16764.1 putative thioesterase [Prochlorococcus sp. MIT 0602]KGG18262.1 putative thioesterase [Prochlorococcus sp. MIT 0603]